LTCLGFWIENWGKTTGADDSYYDGDATYSDNNLDDDEETWMQTTVDVDDGEKISFYWKVSSESGSDHLKFYIDNQYQDQISGEKDWQRRIKGVRYFLGLTLFILHVESLLRRIKGVRYFLGFTLFILHVESLLCRDQKG